MTLQPKQEVCWEMILYSCPSTMHDLQYTMDESASRCKSIPYAKMEQNHVWSSVEAWTDTSLIFRQDAYSPCTQKTLPSRMQVRVPSNQSVADVAFATRSKAKASLKRNAEPSSLPVKLPSPHLTGKVKKFCAISRNSVSSSEAERDPLQTISPKPKKSQQRQVRNLCKKLFQSY